MVRWNYAVLDVFSRRPLAGNQLAVFEDATEIPEHLLQPLAKEIGFSETVYLSPGDAEADAVMRIFTPQNEVPFAGHPTLGAAVLVATRSGQEDIRLRNQRGVVEVRVTQSGPATYQGTMRQPIPTVSVSPDADAILGALGVARSELPVTGYDNGICHLYVVLEDPVQVAGVKPDLQALKQLAPELSDGVVGFNVLAGAGTHWKTRMFAPSAGVDEDPATGSAAGPLALHLARHGLIGWGQEIVIEQGAEIGRPSELMARATIAGNVVDEITVSGNAVVVGGGWFDAGLLSADHNA